MSKVRTTYWGSTPVFAVDYEDGRELREATFFDRREAEAFAAEQGPARASPAAVQRANRAFFDRIDADDPPEPKTLGSLIGRLRSTIQRQTTWVR